MSPLDPVKPISPFDPVKPVSPLEPVKPIVPERSDTNEYAEPFHRYNLEFSESVNDPFSMIANSPVAMPDGDVSADKLATLV